MLANAPNPFLFQGNGNYEVSRANVKTHQVT